MEVEFPIEIGELAGKIELGGFQKESNLFQSDIVIIGYEEYLLPSSPLSVWTWIVRDISEAYSVEDNHKIG